MCRVLAVALLCVLSSTGTAVAQSQPDPAELVDVFDLIRALRNKNAAPQPDWDHRKPMRAIAPVIGAKPSSGALFGIAGNIAFYQGDPQTTHISSSVFSLTISTKAQTSLTHRVMWFTRDDRWRAEADHRFQWTSLETGDLGTSADTANAAVANYDFFRLHHSLFYRLRPHLFAGGGLYYDNHVAVEPSDEAAAAWGDSAYVGYSESRGLPLDAQASAGAGVDVLWDSRDSFINAQRGWLARLGYRGLFEDFLGGDSDWQRVNLDLRTYRPLTPSGRHLLAAWVFGEAVTGGVAPYFDLPATGQDTYGRSARGYAEGQFRGEKLAYAELELRSTLMRNGLLGMVAFVNATTATNLDAGEQLFDSVAPAAGAGLRLLVNKRSRTNLCFDVAFGKAGSRGIYLAVQEAF
jgi:outer membrane protein assembly factor BamA